MMATGSNLELPDHRKRNTFTSYVAPMPGDVRATADTNEWCLPSPLRDVHMAKPRLLSHEQIVTSVPAYMYSTIAPMDGGSISGSSNNINTSSSSNGNSNSNHHQQHQHKEATFGLLSVTNFKLAFVPFHALNTLSAPAPASDLYQENFYLGRNEVTLNNIDQIYTIAEQGRAASALQAARKANNGGRRKKLEPAKQQNINGRIVALHIVCKNFRLLKFAFQQQDSKLSSGASEHGKVIASALARFAYPMRHDLSFAYVYREPYYSTLVGVSMYASKNDWAWELIRCGATEWQVISASSVPQLQNSKQACKYTLPPHFVIPKCCDVDRFLQLSLAFCDSRAAFWVYSYGSSGSSLVRLAELHPSSQQDSKLENIMLELVRKCDKRKQLKLLPLTDQLPSTQDVQRAYHKLRRLCTPESPEKFMMQDDKYLGLLDKSNWLLYVSLCLRCANEAAATLRAATTCVLQESNGRDLCCVISSLTQLLLDPHFRSIDGFQSLVQKDWIALEHPFQRRLGHVYVSSSEAAPDSEQSPVFLLFLDCVWQLLQQFPDEFEFSQTYLTTLWDACFMPIFDTFQFDSHAQRAAAVNEGQLVLRPVWDWGEQYTDKDKMFFSNPLYQRQRGDVATTQNHRRSLAVGGVKPTAGAVVGGGGGAGLGSTLGGGLGASPLRYTINPQLFATQSSVPSDRYLEPAHRILDLSVWDQCYYRWLPVLDIRGGGRPQVDLFQRLLLSNIAKMQRCIDLHNFDELPDAYYDAVGEPRPRQQQQQSKDDEQQLEPVEYVDGVERRRRSTPAGNTGANSTTNGLNVVNGGPLQLSTLSSFFPFGNPIAGDAPHELYDILSSSREMLLDTSSMLDKSSMV